MTRNAALTAVFLFGVLAGIQYFIHQKDVVSSLLAGIAGGVAFFAAGVVASKFLGRPGASDRKA